MSGMRSPRAVFFLVLAKSGPLDPSYTAKTDGSAVAEVTFFCPFSESEMDLQKRGKGNLDRDDDYDVMDRYLCVVWLAEFNPT